jgi:hypothetical protein
MLLNLVKQGGSLAGNTTLGGRKNQSNMTLDANGYPTTMAATGGFGTFTEIDFAVFFQNNSTLSVPYPAGTYVFLYDGSDGNETFAVAYDAVITSGQSTGRILINVATPSSTGFKVQLTAVGLAGNYPKNWRLVYSPDSTSVVVGTNEALLNAGEVLNPAWVSLMTGFSPIRFMDVLQINTCDWTTWSQRPTPNWVSWSDVDKYGFAVLPYEVIVAICNKLSADLYLNFPLLVDDTWANNLATLVRDGNTDSTGKVWSGLNSGLKIYIEHGNEWWLHNFPTALYNTVTGTGYGLTAFPSGGSQFNIGWHWGVLRAIQIGAIFRSAFSNSNRVQRLIAGQNAAGGSGINQAELVLVATDGGGVATSVTITVGNPTVINQTAHGRLAGSVLGFQGTLPTGMSTSQPYYVMSAGLTANSFQITATPGGTTPVSTSGTSSGVTAIYWPGQASSMVDGFAVAPYFTGNVAYPQAWTDSTTGSPDGGLTLFFNALINGGIIPTGAAAVTATAVGGGALGASWTAAQVATGSGTVSNGEIISVTFGQASGASPTLKANDGTAYPVQDAAGNATTVSSGTINLVFTNATSAGAATAGWRLLDTTGSLGEAQVQMDDFTSVYNYVVTLTGADAVPLYLCTYEGGQQCVGKVSNVFNTVYDTLYLAANRDNRMGTVYTKFIGEALQTGAAFFTHFNSIGAYTGGFYWGALESITQATSPKYAALVALMQRTHGGRALGRF